MIRKEDRKLYFFLNFTGFLFGYLVSWRAALFFAVYTFAIWFYSHKLKKYPFLGLFSATVLTILPFFAIFIYYKNFSKIIFVHAIFLFLVLMVRELIKDLQNLKGALANNYSTFPVTYGERKTKQPMRCNAFFVGVKIEKVRCYNNAVGLLCFEVFFKLNKCITVPCRRRRLRTVECGAAEPVFTPSLTTARRCCCCSIT